MNSYYSVDELVSLGFKSIGEDVKISRKSSIYSPEKMIIGNHVRIDDFCILSGTIKLGDYIHIAAACLLFGGEDGIELEDFCGISSRCAMYAESDDYSGLWMSNPTVPEKYRKVQGGGILMRKHSIIGSGCTVFPGVVIGTGCSIGSMSLVNQSIDAWGIYVGIPCRRIKERNQTLLELEKELL